MTNELTYCITDITGENLDLLYKHFGLNKDYRFEKVMYPDFKVGTNVYFDTKKLYLAALSLLNENNKGDEDEPPVTKKDISMLDFERSTDPHRCLSRNGTPVSNKRKELIVKVLLFSADIAMRIVVNVMIHRIVKHIIGNHKNKKGE